MIVAPPNRIHPVYPPPGAVPVQAPAPPPAANAPPSSAPGVPSGSTGSQPPVNSAPAPTGYYQLTPQMITQLEQAVNAAFSGLQGGETNAQIATMITNYLQSTGAWSSQMLAAVHAQALAIGGGNPSFRQQSSTGNQNFVTAWINGIEKTLTGDAMGSASPGTGAISGSTPGNNEALTLAQDLLGMMGGASSSVPSSAPSAQNPYYVAPVSGASGSSGSPMLGILFLILAAVAGIYYYEKHKHGHAEHEA